MILFSSNLPTPNVSHILLTSFWSIIHSGCTVHLLDDPDSPDTDSTRKISIFNEKYIFKLWDKVSQSFKQAQNHVFITDSFSTISHMHNQSSGLIDLIFLCRVTYFHHFFLPYSHFPLLRPLPHAWLLCSIDFLL